jgi:hypothetical protein
VCIALTTCQHGIGSIIKFHDGILAWILDIGKGRKMGTTSSQKSRTFCMLELPVSEL